MKSLHKIAFILVIIGGLNWGLIALGTYTGANWDVVNIVLGGWPTLETLVYLLVGLSALYLISTHRAHCKACN